MRKFYCTGTVRDCAHWLKRSAAVAAVAGCVATPLDGTDVETRTRPVSVIGFVHEPTLGVTIEAREVASGALIRLADTTASNGATRALRRDWFMWSTDVVVPDAAWNPGASGATAELQARLTRGDRTLVGLDEFFGECFERSGTVSTFARDCVGPSAIIICTSDHLPFGSRRSPCPRRAVVERVGDARTLFHALPDTNHVVLLSGVAPALLYRGDGASFIDIFDEVPTANGYPVGGANVVRVRYDRSRTQDALMTVDPAVIARDLGTPTLWKGARSIRHYDIGECSAMMPWRSILDLAGPVLERRLAGLAEGEVTLRPLGRISLTPELRPTGPDAVRLASVFDVRSRSAGLAGLPDIGNIRIKATVTLTVDAAGRLTSTVEPSAEIDLTTQGAGTVAEAFAQLVFGVGRSELIEFMRAEIARSFDLTTLLPATARAVQFDRVFLAPDGLFLVLAEDQRDPQFALVQAAGFCNRPDPQPGTLAAGLHFSLFDPPLRSDHRVLGE